MAGKISQTIKLRLSVDAANGEFYAELSFFKNLQRGSGTRRKKNNPGNNTFEQLLKKRCVISIKNNDDLCFSRAFVSTKAYVDQDPQYENISKGRGVQAYLAYQLHQEAGVPEGPCGSEQI